MAPPIDLRTELLINSVWTDVSAYTLYDNPDAATSLGITRGQADESPRTTASALQMPLDNRDGRFSSRNPLGAYYPYLVQNTQARVSVPEGASYLRCEATGFDFSSTPDSVATSITGDLDVRLDVTLDNWNSAQILAGKWTPSGNQRSWIILLNEDGTLSFAYSADGTAIRTATTTQPVPVPPLHRAGIRMTFSGSGNVVFSSVAAGPNQVLTGVINSSWTLIGSTISITGGAIFDSTAPTRAGAPSGGASADYPSYTGVYGKVHYLEVRNGIAGTVVASPNFTTATAGASSFNDAQGNTWTNQGSAEISNRKYRFHGEVAAWPQSWDPSQTSVVVSVTANGPLRRLGQSSKPLDSAIKRYWKKLASNGPVAYWSMEDLTRATAFGSGLPGSDRVHLTDSKITLAADSSFLCSKALPQFNGSVVTFAVPAYTGTGTIAVRFLAHFLPSVPTLSVMVIKTTGTAAQLMLLWDNTGPAYQIFDEGGNFLSFGPSVSVGPGSYLVSVELTTSGGNYVPAIKVISSKGVLTSNTAAGIAGSVGIVKSITTAVTLNPSFSPMSDATALGHMAIQTATGNIGDFSNPVSAFQGEAAGTRFSRLCSEENIAFRGNGQLSVSSAMGPQLPATLLSLLQECADADAGVMFEPRQAALALGYRTRYSLSNQTPAVTLDYSAAALSGLTPTDDDQPTVNDLTVSRANGSSHRVAITSGAKSTQAPPNGVGTYDAATTLNVASDSQCRDEAGWGTWLGTVNQPRYPFLALNLRRAELAAVSYDLQDLDIGDYLKVTNAPAFLSYDGISQIIKQTAERLSGFIYEADWAGAPEAPYETKVFSDATWGRFDTDGSTLHANISSSVLQFGTDPADNSKPLWTTSQGDFPFDAVIAGLPGAPGERVTVLDISGPPANFLTGDASTFDAGLANWSNVANETPAQVASPAYAGPGAMRMRSLALGNMSVAHCQAANILTQGLACVPGDVLGGSVYLQAAATGRVCNLAVQWFDNAGTSLSTTQGTVTITDPVGSYLKLTDITSFTAPASTAWARFQIRVQSTGAANEDHFADVAWFAKLTGGGNQQTWTVIRSVNGVVKAQTAGYDVRLFTPPVFAM